MKDLDLRSTYRDKLPAVGTTIFSVMSGLARECGAIDLSQGYPDLPMDPELIGLVEKAMRDGHNQYAPMPGLPVLNEAIAAKTLKLHGVRYDPAKEITVTAGATQAIFTAIAALVHPGDEVIIIDPAYDCYAPTVRLFGGVPVHVPLGIEMHFDVDAVETAIGPLTRMIMINSPHNPGGMVIPDRDMKRLEKILSGTDVLLLSDEVYEHIVFHEEGHASAMRYPRLRERAVIVSSFGKTFHGTGWKVGYAVAPDPIMRVIRKVHQFNVFCVNRPMQHAIAAYLVRPEKYETLPELFREKRDRLRGGLLRSRFKPLSCEGTYFQLADYSAISDEDDLTFAKRLTKEHGVAAIPLSPFYNEPPEGMRLVRFCFAKQDATLDAAIEKLCAI